MINVLVICKNDENFQTNFKHNNINLTYCELEKIKKINNVDLCIIETDFSDEIYTEKIKKFILNHSNIIFWCGNKFCTKDDITNAYSIGCKNFVKFPISPDTIESYFQSENQRKKKKKEIFKSTENFDEISVLVIDDYEINIELIKELLSVFKLKKTICFNDAINALNFAFNEKVDLILLDVMMPNLNGFELAEELKKSGKNKDTPIIFISALSGIENKAKGYQLGSVVYIEKPFDVNTVRTQLFNILKIQKLTKQKEEFVATLTHDLRTPIRAQMRATEMLLEEKFGNLNFEQKDILKDILSSCKLLQLMTDDIITKYKLDNGTIKISKSSNCLKSLIEEKINSFQYILEQKKQVVICSYNSKNQILDFDKIELGRVLNNLLINASEYSKEKSKIFIEINDNFENNSIEISIEDEGNGFPAEEVESIFSEYYSKAKKYNKIGAGLGLFISKKIVELHGGEIWLATNEKDKGAKFIFSIPICLTSANSPHKL